MKIGIIGSIGSGLIATSHATQMIEFSKKESQNKSTLRESNPIIIHNHYPNLLNQGSFVCKGKHRYVKVKDQWICQCGRTCK